MSHRGCEPSFTIALNFTPYCTLASNENKQLILISLEDKPTPTHQSVGKLGVVHRILYGWEEPFLSTSVHEPRAGQDVTVLL